MNSLELEIMDYVTGWAVHDIRVDRDVTVHGEPHVQVTLTRAGYEPDVFAFRKSLKLKPQQMGEIIRSTYRKEANE